MDVSAGNCSCPSLVTRYVSSWELLRHLGYLGCSDGPCFIALAGESWEFAASLKEVKPQLDAAGVKLIAVGVGEPRKAQMLGERVPLFPFIECINQVLLFVWMEYL